MVSDLNYQSLSTFVRVVQLTVFVTASILLVVFVRTFLSEKRSPFNIILTLMMISIIIYPLADALNPNEVVAIRFGNDVLPTNPTNLLIVAVLESIFFYCFACLYTLVSYIRSLSIVQLRPAREQYVLKIAVTCSVSLFSTSMVLLIISAFLEITDFQYYTSAGAGFIYCLIDFYYLIQFTRLIRSNAAQNPKLSIIAKYGIIQSILFIIVLNFNFFSLIFPSPLINLVLFMYAACNCLLNCIFYTAMSFKLREASAKATFTSAVESKKIEGGSVSLWTPHINPNPTQIKQSNQLESSAC